MNRTGSMLLSAVVCLTLSSAADAAVIQPPTGRQLRVAVVLTEGATMIDFAGPWEVFSDVHVSERGKTMNEQMPFELFTVGAAHTPIHVSGGLTVVPDYSFADAPPADIVMVGAQRGAPELSAWLRQRRGQSQVVMSVCTGAFKLADAGLFDGKQATTHHYYTTQFASQFPKVKVLTSKRYVQADSVVFSAGGLSSGIDLALHVVELYFGRAVADQTARYMEYQSTAWHD